MAALTGDVSAQFEASLTKKIINPLQNSLHTYEKSAKNLDHLLDQTAKKIRNLNRALSDISAKARSGGGSGSFGTAEGKEEKPWNKAAGTGGESLGKVKDISSTLQTYITFDHAALMDQRYRTTGLYFGLTGNALTKFITGLKARIYNLSDTTGQLSDVLSELPDKFVQSGVKQKDLVMATGMSAKAATAYNAAPVDEATALLTLRNRFGIRDEKGLKNGMAVINETAKLAQTNIADMTSSIIDLISTANGAKFKGDDGLNMAVTIITIAGQEAAHDKVKFDQFSSFLKTLMSENGPAHWSKLVSPQNADYAQFEKNARKHHKSPLIEAFLALRDAYFQSKDKEQFLATALGSHNKTEMDNLKILFSNSGHYDNIYAKIEKMNGTSFDHSFNDNLKSPMVTVNRFKEAQSHVTDHLGEDSLPTLKAMTDGLKELNKALDWADKNGKDLTSTLMALGVAMTLLAVIGQFLTGIISFLNAAMAVLGLITGTLEAPILLVIAGVIAGVTAIGTVLYGLCTHFDVVKKYFNSMIDWFKSLRPSSWFKSSSSHDDKTHSTPPTSKFTLPPEASSDYMSALKNLGGKGGFTIPHIPSMPQRPALGNAGKMDLSPFARQLPSQNANLQKQDPIITVKIEAEKGLKATAWSKDSDIKIDYGTMLRRV